MKQHPMTNGEHLMNVIKSWFDSLIRQKSAEPMKPKTPFADLLSRNYSKPVPMKLNYEDFQPSMTTAEHYILGGVGETESEVPGFNSAGYDLISKKLDRIVDETKRLEQKTRRGKDDKETSVSRLAAILDKGQGDEKKQHECGPEVFEKGQCPSCGSRLNYGGNKMSPKGKAECLNCGFRAIINSKKRRVVLNSGNYHEPMRGSDSDESSSSYSDDSSFWDNSYG
jgi:hypothetical protein